MKRLLYMLLAVFVVMGLSSCLKDSSTTDTTVYDETAITAFSLGTVNRYVTSTGTDGTTKTTKSALTVKNYPFSIDHYQGKIYNTDSLPADCDLKHVLVNVSASTYTGTIFIKAMTGDSLYFYSSTDSLDFTQPREFRAYNSNLSKYRTYMVTVNKAKGGSGSFDWEKMSAGSAPATIDAETRVELGEGVFRLSLDGGTTWTGETYGADEDERLMGDSGYAYLSFPLASMPGNTYHLLIGVMDDFSLMYTVWRKITDDKNSDWVCLMNTPVSAGYPGYLPAADHTSLVYHRGRIIAFQNDGSIYESRDQGISWHKNSTYKLPSGLSTQNLRATGDSEGYVWLVNKDNGDTWRGRYRE